MKKLLSFAIFNLLCLHCYTQKTGIKVTQDNFDNYYSDLLLTKNSGYLLPYRLDVLNKNEFEITEKLEMNIPQIGFTYPFIVLEDSTQNTIRFCGFSNENSYNNIVSCEYNTKTKKYSIINSIQLGQSMGPWYVTPPQYYEGAYYSILNLFSSTYYLLSITLLKVSTLGKFELVKTIDRNSMSKLFSHRWINEIQIINSNRFLFGGSNHYLSIVDTLLNLKYYAPPKHPKDKDLLAFLMRPSLSNINNNIFYLSDQFAETWPKIDETVCKFKIHNDSFSLVDCVIVSNIENENKDHSQITKTVNDIFYTTVSPDFQLSSYKGEFPCIFYVSKFNGLDEVWHKAFGGDHYYHIFDIQMLDTCHVIVTGSVYDYYQNGNLQGFYALIDCNGKLLNFELSDKEIGLNISPNPVQDDLHINMKDQTKSIVKVKIYNIEGSLLKDCTFNSKQNKQIISLSNFNSGMYVATIFDENNKIYSVKFVKH